MTTIRALFAIEIDAILGWFESKNFGDKKMLAAILKGKSVGANEMAAVFERYVFPPLDDGVLEAYMIAEFEKSLIVVNRIRQLGLDPVTEARFKEAIHGITSDDIKDLAILFTRASAILRL